MHRMDTECYGMLVTTFSTFIKVPQFETQIRWMWRINSSL